jgi:hypothetical protein
MFDFLKPCWLNGLGLFTDGLAVCRRTPQRPHETKVFASPGGQPFFKKQRFFFHSVGLAAVKAWMARSSRAMTCFERIGEA